MPNMRDLTILVSEVSATAGVPSTGVLAGFSKPGLPASVTLVHGLEHRFDAVEKRVDGGAFDQVALAVSYDCRGNRRMLGPIARAKNPNIDVGLAERCAHFRHKVEAVFGLHHVIAQRTKNAQSADNKTYNERANSAKHESISQC